MPFLNPTYEHGSSAGYHSQHVGAEKVGEPHVRLPSPTVFSSHLIH